MKWIGAHKYLSARENTTGEMENRQGAFRRTAASHRDGRNSRVPAAERYRDPDGGRGRGRYSTATRCRSHRCVPEEKRGMRRRGAPRGARAASERERATSRSMRAARAAVSPSTTAPACSVGPSRPSEPAARKAGREPGDLQGHQQRQVLGASAVGAGGAGGTRTVGSPPTAQSRRPFPAWARPAGRAAGESGGRPGHRRRLGLRREAAAGRDGGRRPRQLHRAGQHPVGDAGEPGVAGLGVSGRSPRAPASRWERTLAGRSPAAPLSATMRATSAKVRGRGRGARPDRREVVAGHVGEDQHLRPGSAEPQAERPP